MFECVLNDIKLQRTPQYHLKMSIVAYFLSEYDMQAVKDLGYKSRAEAHREISAVFNVFGNYLKRRVDEFDALPESHSNRRGQANREPSKSVVRMAEWLKPYGYQEFLDGIKQLLASEIIARATDEDDDRILNRINNTETSIPAGAAHRGEKKPAPALSERNGRKYYEHDEGVSSNALSYANFKCEINPEHLTFLRRRTEQFYTEAHHLVPMSKQGAFEVSLDVEENVVSLCSNCHNEIHYGKYANKLIESLYEKRKSELEAVGIIISLEDLLKLYR